MTFTFKTIGEAISNGQRLFRSFSKAPTQTTGSGVWFDLSLSSGNPPPQYYFATPLTFTPLSRTTDLGIDHGADVPAGFKKYLKQFDLQTTSATLAPATYELLDYLGYYAGVSMDTGVQTFTNNVAIPRYESGTGRKIMVVEQNPYVGGATFQITYTNQDGVSGRTTPTMTCNSQLVSGTVATSAATLNNAKGLFVPLMDNDYDFQSIDSIEFFTGDVGLLAIVIVKPISSYQMIEPFSPSVYDSLLHMGYLPEIKNDAYLNLCVLPTGNIAGGIINGNLTTIWSN